MMKYIFFHVIGLVGLYYCIFLLFVTGFRKTKNITIEILVFLLHSSEIKWRPLLETLSFLLGKTPIMSPTISEEILAIPKTVPIFKCQRFQYEL